MKYLIVPAVLLMAVPLQAAKVGFTIDSATAQVEADCELKVTDDNGMSTENDDPEDDLDINASGGYDAEVTSWPTTNTGAGAAASGYTTSTAEIYENATFKYIAAECFLDFEGDAAVTQNDWEARVDNHGEANATAALKADADGEVMGKLSFGTIADSYKDFPDDEMIGGMTLYVRCEGSNVTATYNAASDRWSFSGTIKRYLFGVAFNVTVDDTSDPPIQTKDLQDKEWSFEEQVDEDEIVNVESRINNLKSGTQYGRIERDTAVTSAEQNMGFTTRVHIDLP